MKRILGTLAFTTLLGTTTAGHAQNVVSENKQTLDGLVITGTDQTRYETSDKGALTGFPLNFLELPRVVNIIPEQLVLDQKITDLNEALRNTAGITQSDGFGGTNDDFLIRGFRINSIYRDGFRRASNFKTNLTNVDYIQVIRGPAAITYGQVEPGGLIDVVTKKPLEKRRVSGEVRAGSFNDNLLLLDWSEPISDAIGLRVVASTQDSELFRDFSDISRDAIAISGQFELSSSTRLNLSYEYNDESRPLDRGTITVPTPNGREVINNLIDIPIQRRFGEAFEVFESETNFFEANITQDLNDNWTLRLGLASENNSANDLQARPLATIISDQNGPITENGFLLAAPNFNAVFDDPTDQVFLARRTDGSRNRETDVTYFNALLNGELQTGNITHQVAFGFDYQDLETTRFFVTSPALDGVSGPLFNIRNPIFGTLPDSLSTAGSTLLDQSTKEYGLFINDNIQLTDNLSVLIGGRFDEFDADGDISLDKTDAFSPQVAVNYKLSETASVFASYSEAFSPNFVVDLEAGATEPFDPEESDQIELGVKSEFFNSKLQTSAALYSIDKENVISVVNGIPVLLDGQSSQGVELSVSGQPIKGMNIVAGYAYTDAEVSGQGVEGNRPRNVGEHSLNLWTSYEWKTGLGIGGGVFYTDDRFGDDENTFSLDSYTLVDLSAWYTLQVPGGSGDRAVRLQVALKNLTDEEYFSASGGDDRISIGAPRTILGSVSFDF